MQQFQCQGCGGALYFGNRQCLRCGRLTAYLPDARRMVALDCALDGSPVPLLSGFDRRRWAHCANRVAQDICFWLVDRDEGQAFCRSCRLSTLIPNLSDPVNVERWGLVEAAKQWLIHSLLDLGLPFERHASGAAPLEFHLLSAEPGKAVITGHKDGLITVDIAEADDAERARRRTRLRETYRTLLGHLRHEVGHYFWQVLFAEPGFAVAFRALFGDERVDYAQSLRRHYDFGAPADWQTSWVSAYASSHPWEDWAESWAHFMHMADAVDTAHAHGLRLASGAEDRIGVDAWPPDGAQLLRHWHPIALLINDLNRAVGMPDAYPFVVSNKAREKIEFVSLQVRRLADAQGPLTAAAQAA